MTRVLENAVHPFIGMHELVPVASTQPFDNTNNILTTLVKPYPTPLLSQHRGRCYNNTDLFNVSRLARIDLSDSYILAHVLPRINGISSDSPL